MIINLGRKRAWNIKFKRGWPRLTASKDEMSRIDSSLGWIAKFWTFVHFDFWALFYLDLKSLLGNFLKLPTSINLFLAIQGHKRSGSASDSQVINFAPLGFIFSLVAAWEVCAAFDSEKRDRSLTQQAVWGPTGGKKVPRHLQRLKFHMHLIIWFLNRKSFVRLTLTEKFRKYFKNILQKYTRCYEKIVN